MVQSRTRRVEQHDAGMHLDDLTQYVIPSGRLDTLGVSASTRARMARHGCLALLAPGLYLRRPSCPSGRHQGTLQRLPLAPDAGGTILRPETALRYRAVAFAARFGAGHLISHMSAAAVWRLPVVELADERAELLCPTLDRVRRRSTLVLRPMPDPRPAAVIGGRIAVTALMRTVADVAAAYPPHIALVMADHVLASGAHGAGELLEAADRLPLLTHRRRAAAVLGHADRRSESPGESWCRWELIQRRIPLPDLQVPIRDASGTLLARVDALWPNARLILEFDGHLKYGGDRGQQALVQEKRREDRLRAHGYGMVRVVWRDLHDFDPVARRIVEHLSAAA